MSYWQPHWDHFRDWHDKHPAFTWERFSEYLSDGGYGQHYADVSDSRFYALAEQMLKDDEDVTAGRDQQAS